MQLLKKKIVVDTITKSKETFDVDMTVSFTANNLGNSDCVLAYNGGARLMTIEKGTGRDFPGDSGYTYFGEMQIIFLGSESGMVEIVKSVASTEES